MYITSVYIHAQFEDLLNTSAIISKKGFEQRKMLHENYQPFGPNQITKILQLKAHTILKDARFNGNFKSFGPF